MNVNPNVPYSDPSSPLAAVKFQHTMATPQSIIEGSQRILAHMKASTTISIEDGMVSQNNYQQGVAERSQKYPIVVIINGAGGNGKDTFIEAAGKRCAALNLSAINEVKGVAKIMVEISNSYKCGTEPLDPVVSMDAKDDAFRAFLHDIKMAWVKFCDGPAHCLYGEIRKTIDEQINGNESYDVIFLHIREADEIQKVREYLIQQMGLIVLTVLVRGLVDPSTYTNAGDRDVEKFSYDMTITNRYGMMDMLEMQACMFADRLIQANMLYGILSPVIAHTTITPDQASQSALPVDSGIGFSSQTAPAPAINANAGGAGGFHPDAAASGTTGIQ